MASQCRMLGAMFDERSLDCVFTVNFFAGDNTLYASKKLYAGSVFDCTQDWFGLDITTFKENAYRLTRDQKTATAAMLGAGLGTAVGTITSGALDRAIDRHKAEKALDKAEDEKDCNETQGANWVDGKCDCGDGMKWDQDKKQCVEKKSLLQKLGIGGNSGGNDDSDTNGDNGNKETQSNPQDNLKVTKNGDWSFGPLEKVEDPNLTEKEFIENSKHVLAAKGFKVQDPMPDIPDRRAGFCPDSTRFSVGFCFYDVNTGQLTGVPTKEWFDKVCKDDITMRDECANDGWDDDMCPKILAAEDELNGNLNHCVLPELTDQDQASHCRQIRECVYEDTTIGGFKGLKGLCDQEKEILKNPMKYAYPC